MNQMIKRGISLLSTRFYAPQPVATISIFALSVKLGCNEKTIFDAMVSGRLKSVAVDPDLGSASVRLIVDDDKLTDFIASQPTVRWYRDRRLQRENQSALQGMVYMLGLPPLAISVLMTLIVNLPDNDRYAPASFVIGLMTLALFLIAKGANRVILGYVALVMVIVITSIFMPIFAMGFDNIRIDYALTIWISSAAAYTLAVIVFLQLKKMRLRSKAAKATEPAGGR